MNDDLQGTDAVLQRVRLVERKVVETANEAVARGMDPFLCVVVLQTYGGLTVRGAGDVRVAPPDERQDVFFAKMRELVAEYCSGLPGLRVVESSGSSRSGEEGN